ncbi:hypothetical protein [Saccharothrix syringae]|uniref:Uncharacterized protein n=1 Tax=Saccharothrix syringae TaxID=103733 RepID=A0A5Q0H2U9_SACSY|nr:hypothetical protein [Saccharothrix syringae]QFZ20538.1 hypothetical protein EKG83_26810 [Saccharothrix syringae]
MQEIRTLAAPGIAADAARAAQDSYRRSAAVATLIGIPRTPVLEREAREEAAGEAITVAVDGVFGHDTIEYAAMLFIAVRTRNHGVNGAQLARAHLEAIGAPPPPDRAEFMAGQIHTLAEILETSGVDLLDQGRTVTQLRVYAHTFHPQGRDT